MPLCGCRLSISFPLRCFVRVPNRQLKNRHFRAEAADRRTVLVSLGLFAGGLAHSVQAQENGKSSIKSAEKTEDRTKLLRSAAGFEFTYPSSWLVAFERGDSTKDGTIAFVGNFLSIDTFSVERKSLDPIAASNTNLQSVAEEIVKPVQETPASIAFQILKSGYVDTLQGLKRVYVIEYDVNTCKGLVTEGLGGKKLCKDTKDNNLQTVPRHHLLSITRTDDALFYLNASCASDRWDTVKNDLWMTMNSFVAYKNRPEKSS